MWKTSFAVLFFLYPACFMGTLCAQGTVSFLENLSSEKIEHHVYVLASPEFEGRNNGTAGNDAARNYIIQLLEEYQITPANGVRYAVPFQHLGTRGTNIFGWIQGSDPELSQEYLLLSAHYDHLGKKQGVLYPGANDNASGCAALLEISRVLSQQRKYLKRSIMIAFFDAEEDTMKGSLHYAANPLVPLSQLACMMDMDLVGRPLLDRFSDILFVFGTEYSPVLRELAQSSSEVIPMDVQLGGTDLIGPRCDYFSFWIRQIPFVFLTRGQQSAYHQPYDVPETIDYNGLYQVAKLHLTLTEKLANHPVRPSFGKAEYHLDEVKSLKKLLLALSQEKEHSFWIQRFLKWSEQQLNQMLKRKKIRARDRWVLRGIVTTLLIESYRKGSQEQPSSAGEPLDIDVDVENETELDQFFDDFLENYEASTKSPSQEKLQDLIRQFEDEVGDFPEEDPK